VAWKLHQPVTSGPWYASRWVPWTHEQVQTTCCSRWSQIWSSSPSLCPNIQGLERLEERLPVKTDTKKSFNTNAVQFHLLSTK